MIPLFTTSSSGKTNAPRSMAQFNRLQVVIGLFERIPQANRYKAVTDQFLSWISRNKSRLGLNIKYEFRTGAGNAKKQTLEKLGITQSEYQRDKRRKRFAHFQEIFSNPALRSTDGLVEEPFITNVRTLSRKLDFNEVQTKLLNFFADFENSGFESLLSELRTKPSDAVSEDYYQVIATILDCEEKDVRRELADDSLLVGMNFISMKDKKSRSNNSNGFARLNNDAFDINDDVRKLLGREYDNDDQLIEAFMGGTVKTVLEPRHYSYMGDQYDDILGTVQGHVKSDDDKMRITVFAGPPGTGKTELTGVISKVLGVPAFMNESVKASGDNLFAAKEPTRDERWASLLRRAYIAHKCGIQCVLAEDEVEDMLKDLNNPDTKEKGSKDYVNRVFKLLGELKVSIILITNRPDLFDPATVRRGEVFFVENIPQESQMEIVKDLGETHLNMTLDDVQLRDVVERAKDLSIGVIEYCFLNTGRRQDLKSDPAKLKALERAIDRSQRKMTGLIPLPFVSTRLRRPKFDFNLANASVNLQRLCDNFRDAIKGGKTTGNDLQGLNTLLVGPHGSQRVAFARHFSSLAGLDVIEADFDAGRFFMGHPHSVNADDFQNSIENGKALIIKNADPLVFSGSQEAYSPTAQGTPTLSDHPVLERARYHPYPVFFVAGADPDSFLDSSVTRKFSMAIRFGYLTEDQIAYALEHELHIKPDNDAAFDTVSNLSGITAIDIIEVKKVLKSIGKLGDLDETLGQLKSRSEAGKPIQKDSVMGITPRR